ncbi:MAG: MerR family DNA-binding transcriptional regulator [Planctomycetes bacterium]|nr:MerR family DNA-binding transcriptional regulator [Planctomycetota bacterium]
MNDNKTERVRETSEAATILGVSQYTLRAGIEAGRIPMHHNLANVERLFRRRDEEALLGIVEKPAQKRYK